MLWIIKSKWSKTEQNNLHVPQYLTTFLANNIKQQQWIIVNNWLLILKLSLLFDPLDTALMKESCNTCASKPINITKNYKIYTFVEKWEKLVLFLSIQLELFTTAIIKNYWLWYTAHQAQKNTGDGCLKRKSDSWHVLRCVSCSRAHLLSLKRNIKYYQFNLISHSIMENRIKRFKCTA